MLMETVLLGGSPNCCIPLATSQQFHYFLITYIVTIWMRKLMVIQFMIIKLENVTVL